LPASAYLHIQRSRFFDTTPPVVPPVVVAVQTIIAGAADLYIGTSPAGPSAANYVGLGSTLNGATIVLDKEMTEIYNDFTGDACRLIEKGQFSLKTTLAEATLTNLARAVGELDQNVGVFPTRPYGYYFKVIGRGPKISTDTYAVRTFEFYSGLSYVGSGLTHARSQAAGLDVEFRLLPQFQFTGKEYGTITDA
jgi:hypothetical protein